MSRIKDLLDALRWLLWRRQNHIDIHCLLLVFNSVAGFLTKHHVLLCLGFDFSNPFVDDVKLVGPISRINPRTHVVPIIVTTFRVVVETRGQSGCLMTIISVVSEETFYLDSQLLSILIGLLVRHSIKHRYWSESLHFSQVTKHAQLGISQSHIVLIRLRDLSFLKWTKLSRWCCLQHLGNRFKFMNVIKIL